jgi:hypothetical protein
MIPQPSSRAGNALSRWDRCDLFGGLPQPQVLEELDRMLGVAASKTVEEAGVEGAEPKVDSCEPISLISV